VHYTLGLGVPQDHAAGVRWYRVAAENGGIEAQACLGFCYQTGFGVPSDEKSRASEAVIWYRRAADAGNVLARRNLAVCYFWGMGVSQGHAEAARRFQVLAEQGRPTAPYNLGTAYLYGRGVVRDLGLAHEWFKRAVEQGYKNAVQEMVSIEALLSPERFPAIELDVASNHERFIPLLAPAQFPQVEFGFVFTEAAPGSGTSRREIKVNTWQEGGFGGGWRR
jgi:TPR repeat protein